jgi:hypothetical protein
MNYDFFEFEKTRYKIYQDLYESKESFTMRANFIIRMRPNTQQEKNLAVKYSRIYVNNKLKKCEYNNEIMTNLRLMLKYIDG